MEYLTELPPLSPEDVEHMNGFRKWLESQPKPSPYKPWKVVKVKRASSISTLRDTGHKYFDMIWRDLKLCDRNELYDHLAGYLNLDKPETHFKFFNPNQCIEAIEFAIQYLNDDRRLDMDITGIEPRAYFELTII
ncbi:MAG: hypothetical protein JWR05_3500 [Mucilaginibacter sp.]|nr:hypothetical protein [Mucilaginibacter sp.]